MQYTGNQLRLLAQNAGLTGNMLAKLSVQADMPIKQRDISDIFRGKRAPTDREASAIAMLCELVSSNRARAVTEALQAAGEVSLQGV